MGYYQEQDLLRQKKTELDLKVKTVCDLTEKRIQELEQKYAQGKISKKEYESQKKAYAAGIKNLKSTLG